MSDLTSKTPGNTYKDLFHLNNSNNGIDSTLRSIYSGNGTVTKLKLSETKCEIDFNQGECKKALLRAPYYVIYDVGTTSGAVALNISNGSIQKVTLKGNITGITISSDMDSSVGCEFILLLQQTTGTHTLALSSSIYKTPGGSSITLSSNASGLDILRFLTINGGSTWYVFRDGADLR